MRAVALALLTVALPAAAAGSAGDGGEQPAVRAEAKAKAPARLETRRLQQLLNATEAAKDGAAATGAAKADVANAFASTSWYVPPPPAKPAPPPKPTAPPLPFTFMGRYLDAKAATVVMLIKGDRLYTVSEGDVIDDTYRVDRIDDKAVELTYLPLKTKQSLPTGGA